MNTTFSVLKTKFISNVTAKFENDIDLIKSLLVDQVSTRVRWRESIMFAKENSSAVFLEVGKGKVLSGMNKRISKKISSQNIEDMKTIEQFIETNKDIL